MRSFVDISRVGVRLPRRGLSVLRRWSRGELTTRQIFRAAMRVTRFERWGVRPITERRFRRLIQAAETADILTVQLARLATDLEFAKQAADRAEAHNVELAQAKETADALADALTGRLAQSTADLESIKQADSQIIARNNSLATQLAQATGKLQHLRRVEIAYRQATEAADAARHGVQAMMNEWQRIWFEVTETTESSAAVATSVLADLPAEDGVATLINQSEALHGARPFQYAMPILARSRAFPLQWPTQTRPLRVVDVGSQELESEVDMYASLRRIAPVEVIALDPLVTQVGQHDNAATTVEVTRRDSRKISAHPVLLEDGKDVTLDINRYDPTSSIFPSNHDLMRQFGMRDPALETTATRLMVSHRMDDVLPPEDNAAHVDLLKIDVQGAAHMVLENAERILANTLVCHVKVEFAEAYLGEKLFGDVDRLLRESGFFFVDFFSLGRLRYACFETSKLRAFHRGRTLRGDCIYIRGLDVADGMSADELFRAAAIMHACYNKQDLAAELLRRLDVMTGSESLKSYLDGVMP